MGNLLPAVNLRKMFPAKHNHMFISTWCLWFCALSQY